MSFLLPTAIILSTCSCSNVSELYKTAATLSLGLLGSSVVFLAKTCNCKTYEYAVIIPPVFTYVQLYFYNKIGKLCEDYIYLCYWLLLKHGHYKSKYSMCSCCKSTKYSPVW